MKDLVGAPCWWGAWGPGHLPPPPLPLKSGPETYSGIHEVNIYKVRHYLFQDSLQ